MTVEARYEVLGVPLILECEDARLAAVADDCLLRHAGSCHEPPLRLRIDTVEKSAVECQALDVPQFGVEGAKLWIRNDTCDAWADKSIGAAQADVCASQRFFERGFPVTLVETLALFLAFGRRPITLHASALVLENRCVLLTGDEGTGKSTTAYACLRAGMTLVSDDVVYQSPTALPRYVWGHPASLYLLPDASSLFLELVGMAEVVRLNGERKIRVPVLSKYPGRTAPGHLVHGIVCLNRIHAKRSVFRTVSRETLAHSLTAFKGNVELSRPAMWEAAQRLADGPSAALEMGSDPDEVARAVIAWTRSLPEW